MEIEVKMKNPERAKELFVIWIIDNPNISNEEMHRFLAKLHKKRGGEGKK